VAVSESRIEIVELLLSRGAMVNTCDDVTGASPLLKAVARKRPSIVELLLRSGADVSLRNSSDQSAFDLAKTMGDDEIIELLDQTNH
jgi:ankyrin repeat protein